MVPAAGYEIDFLRLRGLDRGAPLKAAGAAALAAAAVPAARQAPASPRAPMRCWAAAATWPGPAGSRRCPPRMPLVLTEADRHLGLANRLLARGARRVCLAFPIEGREGDRYLVTGRPVPPAIVDRRPRGGPAALRHRGRRALPARLRRQPGRPVDQPLRARRFPRRRRRPRSATTT